VRLAREAAPDVVLMDLSMPELNGADATRAIVEHDPRCRVIVLSMYSEREYVRRALKAGAPRSARIVEPRLTGGFPWAGYHGPLRAVGGSADAERLELGGAAGALIRRAEHDPSAEAQHAAGVAMVLVEKPDEAITRLESAARTSHDASTWSDLAAARYATAVQFRRPSLYSEALAASNEALRIDARLPEPLFNRALILETMGSTSEARRAWQRYLQVDPGSPWANEARAHLAELPLTTGSF